jgi:hypothetical protein
MRVDERIVGDVDGLGTSLQSVERGRDVFPRRISIGISSTLKRTRGAFELAQVEQHGGAADVGEDADAGEPGDHGAQEPSRFAARSVCWIERPVTLPPGRDRLATRPAPTGSPAAAKTIGISQSLV